MKWGAPLVHCIANYVSAADCANALYAAGARAIMADEPSEMRDVSRIADALSLNIGTLNSILLESMMFAEAEYNNQHKPVVFDPVGVGVSDFRKKSSTKILYQRQVNCICGNYSEILCLLNEDFSTDGVDSNKEDKITEDNLDTVIHNAKILSEKTDSIVAVTGAIDVVVDENSSYVVFNGCREMGKLMGTGCIASSLCAAYLSVGGKFSLKSVSTALVHLGIAGEVAKDKMTEFSYMNFKNLLIDSLSQVNKNIFEERAKYEVR